MMNPYHLQAFQVVAQQLNFRRAAERLNISQPALSSQIRKLENELEVVLFERNRKQVRLTSAGEELLAGIPDYLLHGELLEKRTRQTGAGEIGVLRVSFVSTASVLLLPTIVKLFGQHPGIRLLLRNWITGEQVSALATPSRVRRSGPPFGR